MPAAKNGARVAAHRAALRAQGLRPIQLWIPGTRTPEFAEQARQASLAANASDSEKVMDLLERIGILDNEDDDAAG